MTQKSILRAERGFAFLSELNQIKKREQQCFRFFFAAPFLDHSKSAVSKNRLHWLFADRPLILPCTRLIRGHLCQPVIGLTTPAKWPSQINGKSNCVWETIAPVHSRPAGGFVSADDSVFLYGLAVFNQHCNSVRNRWRLPGKTFVPFSLEQGARPDGHATSADWTVDWRCDDFFRCRAVVDAGLHYWRNWIDFVDSCLPSMV